jgi:hypothetical protein
MNIYIWAAAIILLGVAVYRTVFSEKPICSVTIYELNKGNFVRHKSNYNGYIRKARNKGNDKTIYWFEIRGQGKKWSWRPIQFHEYITTDKGKKHVTMAWLGGNDFRVINPKVAKHKFLKLKNGDFKRMPQKSIKFEVYTEEDQYFLSDIYDELDELYKRKGNWWDQVKPFATIAIVGIIALMIIWVTADKVMKSSENVAETRSWMQDLFEGRLESNPDDRTKVTTNPPNKGDP